VPSTLLRKKEREREREREGEGIIGISVYERGNIYFSLLGPLG